ncbi:MAG: hypothetical protein D6681_07105, partial [Calditrichaeota bacterium]
MFDKTLLHKGQNSPQPFEVGLPTGALNIEEKVRSNLFPWRGQFSPQFVEVLLKAYAYPQSVVLDPFMGSGTVLVESARLGHEVHGFEINPSAYVIARVYEFCNLDIQTRDEIVLKVEQVLRDIFSNYNDLPLFTEHYTKLHGSHKSLVNTIAEISQKHVQALLEAVLVLANSKTKEEDPLIYWAKWKEIKDIVYSLPYSQMKVEAHLGDARDLRLPDHTIDFVLSSPPYINVFNYHHNYRLAVETLGWKPLIVARSEIGSNRKFRQNRFFTVVQYCMDMAMALRELQRVCKETARIILVVGKESRVHKTPFFNGEIISAIATHIVGYKMVLQQRRVFRNRFGQNIYEDIIHLVPSGSPFRSQDEIVCDARVFGTEILRDARKRVPSDRLHFLTEAISRIQEIAPSPVLDISIA